MITDEPIRQGGRGKPLRRFVVFNDPARQFLNRRYRGGPGLPVITPGNRTVDFAGYASLDLNCTRPRVFIAIYTGSAIKYIP